MFFQSQASNIVSGATRTAIESATSQRKERAIKQLLSYQNDFEIYIQDYLKRNYLHPEKRTPLGVNVVRKIIRNLAQVYNQDAKRRIEGTEADKAIFAEIETTASLPVLMKQANRLSKLLGTVLLRPVWRGGRMTLDLLTPDILDVSWGDTPHDLQEVVITANDPSGQATEVTFSRWTPELFQRLDYQGQILEQSENPYGRLPFIPLWSEPPLDSFWLAGATDLIMIQDGINAILSDLLFTLQFQSSSVFYIKGAGNLEASLKGQPLVIGPGQVIVLPEKGEVGFSAPNAPIEQALAAVESLMKQAAMTNGLSAASVNLKPQEESGRSKIVGNSELAEQRADDVALFARYEDQLFDLFRTIWNTHNPGRTISPEAVLWCQFYQPEPAVSPFEKAQTWRTLLDIGVISKVDILMSMNPDLSREQAIAQLAVTQKELQEFSDEKIYPSLAGFRAAIPE